MQSCWAPLASGRPSFQRLKLVLLSLSPSFSLPPSLRSLPSSHSQRFSRFLPLAVFASLSRSLYRVLSPTHTLHLSLSPPSRRCSKTRSQRPFPRRRARALSASSAWPAWRSCRAGTAAPAPSAPAPYATALSAGRRLTRRCVSSTADTGCDLSTGAREIKSVFGTRSAEPRELSM